MRTCSDFTCSKWSKSFYSIIRVSKKFLERNYITLLLVGGCQILLRRRNFKKAYKKDRQYTCRILIV